MAELRTIEIDFDVHKRLELARESFAETPNDVLRRLLDLTEEARSVLENAQKSSKKSSRRADKKSTHQDDVGGHAWSGKGVSLPHGTELRMKYNGRVHIGRIDNGIWRVEDKEFNSPSAAAGGVALTKDGKHPSLDGWAYWQVKRPGETDWADLKELRHAAANGGTDVAELRPDRSASGRLASLGRILNGR